MNSTVKNGVIYTEREGTIGRVILNRAEKRNAMSEAMWAAIPAAVAELDADPQVRVIILTSNGQGAFSAGADIAELQVIATDPERRESNRKAIRDAQRCLARAKKPTIAVIWGACIGGGCGLALHCDFRFAATKAKFAITPAKLGIVYPLNDTKQLIDLVGPSKAKSLLFTGRMVAADEALAMGLVDHVCSEADLTTDVQAFAAQLASASQYSIQHMKHFVQRVLDGQIDDDETTAQIFKDAQEGEDAAEGVTAFLEKRSADFRWSSD
ncbi:MAG: enoyl-CoA hydratase/isomerase family protein [Kordiimonadaceae bacterium]|nr:enoyl-CoA hydratase/isomerase family protein [Kordiimonadaceae bacterium]